MYIHVYAYVHQHRSNLLWARECTNAHTCTCKRAQARTQAQTHTYKHTHAHISTYNMVALGKH